MDMGQAGLLLDLVDHMLGNLAWWIVSDDAEVDPVPNPRLTHHIVHIILEVDATVHLMKLNWLANAFRKFLLGPLFEFFHTLAITGWSSRVEELEHGHVVGDA